MTRNAQFDQKWSQSLKKDKTEESYVFVRKGLKPWTQRQLFLYQYYQLIKNKSKGIAKKSVLEMGCGRGTVSLYFALYDYCQVSLCDVSKSAVDLARENFSYFGATGTIVESGAEKTPFTTGEFDLVFSIGLLEHLEDYQEIVNEKFRTLRAGGVVASLNIPQKRSIQELNTWYRKILSLCGYKGVLKPDYYRNTHTPEMYRAAFLKAGFVDIEIMYVTPFPLFTPLSSWAEHGITAFYRFLLSCRGVCMEYPFATNKYAGQAHFIFARKP